MKLLKKLVVGLALTASLTLGFGGMVGVAGADHLKVFSDLWSGVDVICRHTAIETAGDIATQAQAYLDCIHELSGG